MKILEIILAGLLVFLTSFSKLKKEETNKLTFFGIIAIVTILAILFINIFDLISDSTKKYESDISKIKIEVRPKYSYSGTISKDSILKSLPKAIHISRGTIGNNYISFDLVRLDDVIFASRARSFFVLYRSTNLEILTSNKLKYWHELNDKKFAFNIPDPYPSDFTGKFKQFLGFETTISINGQSFLIPLNKDYSIGLKFQDFEYPNFFESRFM